jgi:3-hydroxybutyryl-CoA dehydratase
MAPTTPIALHDHGLPYLTTLAETPRIEANPKSGCPLHSKGCWRQPQASASPPGCATSTLAFFADVQEHAHAPDQPFGKERGMTTSLDQTYEIPLLARAYDELEVGSTQLTRGRTIGESDIINFCASTGDWYPIHSDAVYASNSMFRERVAPGIMVLAYITGLGIPADSKTLLANYGFDRIRFPRPTRIGDTIKLEVTVAELQDRDESSGIATLDWNGINQNGDTVCASKLKVLMSRGTGPMGGGS